MNHCSNCGAAITAVERAKVHPHCAACATTHWQNPRPVAVLLQPVRHRTHANTLGPGLAIGRRAIAPHIGGWCLPAGFVEPGQNAEQAAAEELAQELNLAVRVSGIRTLETKTFGPTMLVLCTTDEQVIDFTDLPFEPNDEVSERRVIWKPEELCYPYHTEVVREWFKGRMHL